MCDPRDLGQTLGDGSNPNGEGGVMVPAGRDYFGGRVGRFDPTVFLFDAHAGGVGLAPRIFERAEELLGRVHTLLAGCPCEAGCPACVGPSDPSGVRKRLALRLLAALAAPALRAEAV
jgi:DEAD/DEAH box helicase domain-containing protein